ncbi:MAG: beta-lactamase family protein [Candidatus Pacebacteria bacterium]|nr:beta-lactamase family protein [Candidatus Paceibacterota bacterium]
MTENIIKILKQAYEERLFTSATLAVQYPDGGPHFFTASDEGTIYVPKLTKSITKIHDVASVTKFLLSMLFYRLMTIRKDLVNELLAPGINGKPLAKEAFARAKAIKNFHPESRVSDFMFIGGSFSNNLLVRHLLNFHAEFNLFMKPDEIIKHNLKTLIDQLRNIGFVTTPGLEHKYRNAHSILLGVLLEHVYGEPLEVLFQKHLIEPLGLSSTTTNPSGMLHRTMLSSHDVPLGKVHDPVARMALVESRLIGSAGLFSSAQDLMKVVNVILNNGYIGLTTEEPFILPFWIHYLHKEENPERKFASGMAYWERFRDNLEHLNPTPVRDGLFKSGTTGSAVVAFREIGAGYALTTDFLAVPRTVDELEKAKKMRSALYLLIGQSVISTSKYMILEGSAK